MPETVALQKLEEIPLLKLFCNIDPGGHAEPVIPVRWCLSAELVATIRARGFEKPHLMIIVRQFHKDISGDSHYDGFHDEDIYVVPLEREMEFVTIYSPGTKQIVANVIDVPGITACDVIDDMRDKIHNNDREFPDYSNRSVFNTDGSVPVDANRGPRTKSWDSYLKFIDTKAIVEFEVEANLFAKEPRRASRWLVNNYFEGKGRDQCHFRKRLGLSLFFVPPTLIFLWPPRIIGVLIFLWLGKRNVNLRALLPLEMALWFKKNVNRSSVWFTKKEKSPYGEHYNYRSRSFTWWIINPIVFTLAPFWVGMVLAWPIRYTGSKHTHPMVDGSLWHAALYAWSGLFAIVGIYWLVIGVFFLLTVVILKLDDETRRDMRRLRELHKEEANRREINKLYGELSQMTCVSEAVKADVRALPARKQTVHLRFLDLKKQVCRPFAK